MNPKSQEARSSASPSRAAAFEVLFALEKRGSPPLDNLLHAALERTALAAPDRALLFHIAQGVTRHRTFLDAVLAGFLRAGAEVTPLPVRIALRMGAFQRLFLDRVPVHAIVNETVELVRAAGFSQTTCGFVNAVMRKVATLDKPAILALRDTAPRRDILQRFSIPGWIAREIESAYGATSLRAECEAFAQPAPIDLRVNRLKADPNALASTLTAEPGHFSPDTLRLANGVDVTQLSAWRDGLITLQDEAAQLVAHFLSPQPGQRIADFCAAPGGKTTHLAALLENRGELWVLDADPTRLDTVRETCARLGATCVRFALNTPATRARWTASPADALDAALVDPPCTNLGTIRRHPDVKWRHRADDPARMARKQLEILSQAAACVRPGGTLVYSVCTFTRAETVDVIDAFLRASPEWQRDLSFTPPPFIPPTFRTPSGDYLTQTSRDQIDAFFLSRLRHSPR